MLLLGLVLGAMLGWPALAVMVAPWRVQQQQQNNGQQLGSIRAGQLRRADLCPSTASTIMMII
jgi:hypothetical protein